MSNNPSQSINDKEREKGKLERNQSRLIKAMEGWQEPLETVAQPPKGSFGRECMIQTPNVKFDSKELDFEFTIPFDDEEEADEAEIIVYNLSPNTIENLKTNDIITVTAGYQEDTGIIFSGYISTIKTKWDNLDKKTVIHALDAVDFQERKIENMAFQKGSQASYILKTLLEQTKLPIAVWQPQKDKTYQQAVNISGDLMENINRYAKVCGITVYISKGRIFARSGKDGDDIQFTVNANTGLIGSPEAFEEENNNNGNENEKENKKPIKGYKVKMLLQHRMTTAAIINLASRDATGKYRVRAGQHTFNESEAITEIEVI